MMSWETSDDRVAMSASSTQSACLSPMVVSPPDANPSANHWNRTPQGLQSDGEM